MSAVSGTPSLVVGVDVGGTFTDLFVLDEASGQARIVKVPSTRGEEARGFMNGIAKVTGANAQGETDAARAIATIVHGTTVGTNALLERKVARTGILTTRGFRDVLEMRRRDRPQTWGLRGSYTPVVPRALRFFATTSAESTALLKSGYGNAPWTRNARPRRAPMPPLRGIARRQAITDAGNRVQQRPLERLVDRLAQRVQVAAQGVGVGQQVAPDFALELLPAHDAGRGAHQHRQKPQADRHQAYRLAVPRHLHRGQVELEVGNAQRLGDHGSSQAPQQRADARLELADLERLDEGVVGAGIEPEELVLEGVA